MIRRFSALFCGLLATACAFAQPEQPTIAGYVTRAVSGTDFDVNKVRVLCRESAPILLLAPRGKSTTIQGCAHISPYVGEPIRIFGLKDDKAHTIDTKRIELPQTSHGEVSGVAVIDAVPDQDPAGTPAAGLTVRADGYRILIDANTQIAWIGSLHTLSEVKAGAWIEYKGKENSDGTVTASSVKLASDAVSQGEQKLRTKNDFDPAAVPSTAKQNVVREAFLGYDPKRCPPYPDAAMQERVSAIGEKLIPAYQRNLPASDPAKIQFRFQVINTKKFRDALTLPSGVILVPRQVVERMQNDAQLAVVLADNIACALEKQTYRAMPASRALVAGYYGAQIAEVFVPGLGLAGVSAGLGGAEAIKIKAEHQSGRVSLGLLNDAGYDIDQAPLAWWLLAPKKPTPIWKIPLPDRAANLYRNLGQTWHNPTVTAAIEN